LIFPISETLTFHVHNQTNIMIIENIKSTCGKDVISTSLIDYLFVFPIVSISIIHHKRNQKSKSKMAAMQVTLENIALSKLLNYVPKQTLVDFVSPKKYAEVEHRLRQQLDKSKITLKDMKQHLATSPQIIQSVRNYSTNTSRLSRDCVEWTTAKRRQSERS
jgi:hypothetical protein